MANWTGEEWQYDILVAAHKKSFKILKQLWLSQVLGRDVLDRGLFEKDFQNWPLHDIEEWVWARVHMAEFLVRGTDYPKLKRPSLELWPCPRKNHT